MKTREHGVACGIREAWASHRRHQRFVWWRAVIASLAVVWVVAIVTLASAQQTAPAPTAAQGPGLASAPASGLDAIAATLDTIAHSLSVDALSDNQLAALKAQLAPLRDQLHDRLADLAPDLKQVEQRLGQLGGPPREGAVEDAAVASERGRLATRRASLDGAIKQAQVLSDRAEDLDNHINSRRRELFTNRLLAHSTMPFDPGFWIDLAAGVGLELRGLSGLATLWAVQVRNNASAGVIFAAVATLFAIFAAGWFVLRWGRRLIRTPAPRRFDKAVAALLILCAHTATVPLLVVASVIVLRDNGLMPSPISDISFGLASAVALTGFGRGVAVALFAPGEAARRIVAWSDIEADSYSAHLTRASWIFGLAVFLNVVHRNLGSPVAPIVGTGALLALAIMGIAFHQLWRSSQPDFRDAHVPAARPELPWLRGVFWLISIAIAAALLTGYVSLAVFIAVRLLAALAIGGALTIIVVFVEALLTEVLAPDTPYGRRIAALLGLSPRGLELAETLVSAVLRLALVVLGALLVLGYSSSFAEDVFVIFKRTAWDYVIGGVNLSPGAVLASLALLVVGGLLIRRAQQWLQTKFLPRTDLDAGLQNSILALFGYVGLIAVVTMALATLGIDLQKIALIAGALSVGIGFGLQSVVSNFVSGLILLAERPIRVGDWVVVKNEEGWVRRISVRATEIETFDRASVIIPNQEFITGVVKNWTHGNTMGRVVIKVRVTYDSDPVTVREMLLACADRHPAVLKAPPPVVFLMAFGDIGLDFELRCLLGNVEQSLTVRSELQIDILARLRDLGIKIPSPAYEEKVPGPTPLAPAKPPSSPPQSSPAGT